MVLLRTLVLFVVGLIAVLFVQPAFAATVPVTNTLDSGPGSLRQAMLDAAQNDTVIFSQDVFSVPQTIALTTGQIEISKSLTIDGAADAVVTPTISGHWPSRVLFVRAGISMTLSQLIIANGDCSYSSCSGAGIFNSGTVNLAHVRLVGNKTFYAGGSIYNDSTGVFTITDSDISGNVASDAGGAGTGGGIANYGVLAVYSSTFYGNYNAGIANFGAAIVVNSTFDRNGESGIDNIGALRVSNSVFLNNSVGHKLGGGGGGGIENGGIAVVTNSTFAGNSADWGYGGGIVNYSLLTTTNSTFTGNHASFHDDGFGGIGGYGAVLSQITAR